jgi:CDP-glycerol glycerophosphotransferase (TagB/SpsB family)
MSMDIFRHLTFVVISIFSWITPRTKKKWVYIAGTGQRFAENSKYLFLKNSNREEEVTEHVWIGTSEEVIKELNANDFTAYHATSIKGKYHLLTAGVAIETHGPQFGQYLGGATIIDTHHGNALKTMGSDETGEGSRGLINHIKEWIWNRLITISYFQVTSDGTPKETFKKARQLTDSEILIAPYPRLDPFFNFNSAYEIGINKQMLNNIRKNSLDKNIVIYAPTWREAFGKKNGKPLSEIKPDLESIDDLMEETESLLYISTHPREPIEIDYRKYENISNLKTDGDIYPFLRYCDVLVTDYSSIFYDFLFADQPICFYAPDLTEYQATRGLYFEYEEHVPGSVSKSTSELLSDLKLALAGRDQYTADRLKRLSEFYVEPDEYPSEYTQQKIREVLIE